MNPHPVETRLPSVSPRAARALAVAASLTLILAALLAYAARAAFDSDQFANRATAALEDESVREVIGERVADEAVRKAPNLIATRPIIEAVASEIAGSPAFTALFRAACRDVHRAVFDRDEDSVTLTVADVGTVVAAAVEQVRPELAERVRSTGAVELIDRDIGSVTGDLARTAERTERLALLLLVVALGLTVAAIVLAPDRRLAVRRLGSGVAAASVAVVIAYGIARALVVGRADGPANEAAAGAIWDAFLGDLRTGAWALAACGAVVAAAAASLLRPVELGQPLRRVARRIATQPTRPWPRAAWALGSIAAGLVVILAHEAVLRAALSLAGVYLVYAGATALLGLVYRPELEPDRAARRRSRSLPSARRLAVVAIAVALVVGVAGLFVGGGGTSTAAPSGGPCNGHRELCDRPLDRVVLPATHNSMSVPLPGWFSALQERPIADQLDDGVRGLLIDAHYAARLPDGKLRTDFGDDEELRRQASRDGVSPDAVDAAMRLRARLGFRGEGERGMYLCHTFCELGATPLSDVLDDLRDFLVNHPDDVLAVIVQDYVTPEDFVAAVGDSDLAELAYAGPLGDGAPTLREMVDSGKRVVFLAENRAGAAPWYRLAYDGATQETPYGFSRSAQLTESRALRSSCEPNRGGAEAPLFLINHWVTTDPLGLPSNAAKVNAYEPLLRRARRCRRQRGHIPNLLAVDFYREGDLFRVADTLNGVD